jgi:hypothetical protein
MPDLIPKKKLSPSTLDALAHLESMLPEYECRPSLGMAYGRENKYVTWRFDPSRYKTIELLHITDVQYGHVECQVDRLNEYFDWVLAEPNRFILFGGDMIDAANVLSPGQPWENICGPQSQVYQFCELAARVRHRILGYVGGNHERRGLKSFGDIGLMIAYLLKIPYSSGQQLVDVHFGQHRPFKIHLYHGRGAARTKGAKVMMLNQLMKDYPGSQLYLVGHLHDCFILPTIVWERIPGRNNVKMQKAVGAMSSSFLNFFGTYAEVAGMSANDVLMVRTILEPNGHFEATIR